MNRKKQRCPYCGKRLSYFSAFFSRRKAEYVCVRCGKESKVVITKTIIPIFIIVVALALMIMGVWFFMKWMSNPLGIVLVAVPLLIFLLLTPKFVQLGPLKKYQKSMEAKKAGIEFSDNLASLEMNEETGMAPESTGQFKINSDLFNQIKSERATPREQAESNDIVSNSEKIGNENYVHVINDVSEDHAKTTSYPLKKLHAEGTKIPRPRHYLDPQPKPEESADDSDVKEYKKSDSHRYSGNRRF